MNPLDRAAILGAVMLIFAATMIPLAGRLPASGAQTLILFASGFAIAGGYIATRGTRPAVILLWIAAGLLLVLGVLSIFSIGLLFIIAALLIVSATTRTAER